MVQEKILIIEDEEDIAQMLSLMVQDSGYQAIVAGDGVQGLQAVLNARPDLILLDLYLPKMSGIQVLHALHKQQIRIPVVVVTAGKSEELVIETLRMGVKDYIKKPFSIKELLDVIQRALTESRLRREQHALTRKLWASNRELARRVSQLTALYEVAQGLASILDLDELIRVILQEAERVLQVDVTSIMLLDERTGELIFRSGTGKGAELLIGRRLQPGQGIAGWVARTGQPLLVPDTQSDPRFDPVFDRITNWHTRSVLCVPLMVKGRVIGVLEALNKPKGGFTQDDKAVLSSLAASAAVAIENARLYKTLQESRDQVAAHSRALEKRLGELSRLQKMTMELGRVTIGIDLPDVFRRLTEHAAALLEAESSAILLLNPEQTALICQSPAFGVPPDIVRDYRVPLDDDSPARLFWRRRQPLIVNDVAGSPLVDTLGLRELQQRIGLRSTVMTVLQVSGRAIGVLQVSDKRDGSDFTDEDARVLEIFASHSAIAIENARILQRVEALNKVGEAITSRLTLPAVLDRVVDGINELIDVEGTSIWLMKTGPGGDQHLSLVASLPDKSWPAQFDDLSIRLGEGFAGLVAQTGQPLIVHDVQDDPRYSRKMEERTGLVVNSILCVPLQVGHEVSGVIEVINKIGGKFDREDMEILTSVAAAVSVAVENARLFTSERRRASEMEALVEIARAITEAVTETPRELLERIARGVCQTMEADCAIVYPFLPAEPGVYDVENIATYGTFHFDTFDPATTMRLPTQAVRRHELWVCENVDCARPGPLQDPLFAAEQIQSFVGVLLKADDDELGVLYINFRHYHRFEEHELTFVRLIAHQTALAIAKSRLFQSLDQELVRANAVLRRKVRELEELQTINNIISASLEIDKVWDSILHGAMVITHAPYAGVLLKEEHGGHVVFHMRRGDERLTRRFDPYDTVIIPTDDGTDYRTALELLAEQSVGGIPWGQIYRQLAPDTRSVLHTPIFSGRERQPIGLLVIGSPHQDAFTADDRRLLEALANQAAIAIQNARHLQAVRTLQEQQVEAERIAAMADVAGNMVHNINNMVGAIRPLIQQIEMKMEQGRLSDDYLRDKLRRIRENADRTLAVARQIRRPFTSIQPEPVDVNQSIAAAWEGLTAPVGVRVDFEYGDDLPPVRATRQLDEVFRNLIRNALDAMAEQGGFLMIRSRRVDDHMVIVSVQDTGPGIPEDMQEKVFHMGTTTKQGGMGYGLWWSRTFLRRLGGDILLESEEGRGCTFTVMLPVAAGTGD